MHNEVEYLSSRFCAADHPALENTTESISQHAWGPWSEEDPDLMSKAHHLSTGLLSSNSAKQQLPEPREQNTWASFG